MLKISVRHFPACVFAEYIDTPEALNSYSASHDN